MPLGCLEKHGQHMPVGTDVIHITEIAKRAEEKEDVCIFPSIYFGEKTGAGEFAGTVIFSPELRLQILKETCSEIYRNGFDKILIYDGHGGNSRMIDFFMRRLLYEKTPYSVFSYLLTVLMNLQRGEFADLLPGWQIFQIPMKATGTTV